MENKMLSKIELSSVREQLLIRRSQLLDLLGSVSEDSERTVKLELHALDNLILTVTQVRDRMSDAKHSVDAIISVARSGKKIEAVKMYRNTFGTTLKDSKEAVERMM